jgi:C4-dicarboxylate-specific signal transduction histidine kinase
MQTNLCAYASILLAFILLILATVLHKTRKKIHAQKQELHEVRSQLEALTKSESLLKEAQALTAVGSYEIDLISQKRFWTEQAAKNFGLPAETDMNVVDWAGLIDPSDKIIVNRLWQEAVEKLSVFDCKYRIIKPNGEPAYMHGIGRPIVDESGFPVKFVGTIRDITESTMIMHRLRDQEIKALQSERMAYFGKIAGAVAHEINNPLAIMQGGIHVLQRLFQKNQISPDLFRRFSNQMDRAVQRVTRIVKSIQSCSTDSTNESFSLTDAAEMIDTVAELFSSLARIQGIVFKVSLPAKGIDIECQPNEISQAMLNLLMNARDAVSNAVGAMIVLETNVLGDKLMVRVSNNGQRIPLEQIDKIWQPFYSTKDYKKSLGLGLCVSKAIIERHGGTIVLEKERSDTSFVILMPLKRVDVAMQKLLAI